MKKLLFKRLLLFPLTLFFILCANFFLIHHNQKSSTSLHSKSALIAHDFSERHLLSHTLSFKSYLKKAIRFDFGHPLGQKDIRVSAEVYKHFKVSLPLLVLPLLLSFTLSQIMGLLLASQERSFMGFVISSLFMILYAAPVYLIVPLLLNGIGLSLNLPKYGLDFFQFKALLLPVFAMTYGSFALYARLSKNLFAHLREQPHILFAKAKGLSSRRIMFVHLLQEGMVTMLPLFLSSIGGLLSSLVIVENLFEIKGFGYLFYQALLLKDTPTLLVSILFASSLSIGGYLLADIVLYLLDPRVRHHAKVLSYS